MKLKFELRVNPFGPLEIECGATDIELDNVISQLDATMYEVIQARKQIVPGDSSTSARTDELKQFYKNHPPS